MAEISALPFKELGMGTHAPAAYVRLFVGSALPPLLSFSVAGGGCTIATCSNTETDWS